jgi:hypothetical protein
MEQEIVEVKINRNPPGSEVEQLNVTIPKKSISLARRWARENSVTLSRAVSELIIAGYHGNTAKIKKESK